MKLPAASCCAIVLLAAANLAAQVVELPSFQSFGTSTTVVVPDRGTASLGGINSAGLGAEPIRRAAGQPLAQHHGTGHERQCDRLRPRF